MKINWKSWKTAAYIALATPMLYIFAIYAGWIQTLPDVAATALTEAGQVTLYSLDDQWSIALREDTTEDFFHSYPIAGKAELGGADAKKAIDAFLDASAFWMPGEFQCFTPHHALRIVSNGHTYDYLLCYMCNAILIYEDQKKITYQNAGGTPDVLDGLLKAGNVPLKLEDDPEYIPRLTARAKQGKLWAQDRLGSIYYSGQGVRQDYAEAAKWWRIAAEGGDSSAQLSLAGMYQKGKGVKQDFAEAAFWAAVAGGDFWNDDYYKRRGLATEQILATKKRVKEWREAHPARTAEKPSEQPQQ